MLAKPSQPQFVFFYQHIWPDLRPGSLMSDLVAAALA